MLVWVRCWVNKRVTKRESLVWVRNGARVPSGRPRSRAGLQSWQETCKLGREALQGSPLPQKHTYLPGNSTDTPRSYLLLFPLVLGSGTG